MKVIRQSSKTALFFVHARQRARIPPPYRLITAAYHTPDARPAALFLPSATITPTRAFTQSHRRQHAQQSIPNHFELFAKAIPAGPPPFGPFSPDLPALKSEFIRLQAAAHPDRHPGEADNRRAQAQSALVNEAYKTLVDPLARAQYLLSLRGAEVSTDEEGKVDDAELLGEILELREGVEEAEDRAQIEEMARENEWRIADSIGRLENFFKGEDVAGARAEVIRLRYWYNLRDSLREWEPRGA